MCHRAARGRSPPATTRRPRRRGGSRDTRVLTPGARRLPWPRESPAPPPRLPSFHDTISYEFRAAFLAPRAAQPGASSASGALLFSDFWFRIDARNANIPRPPPRPRRALPRPGCTGAVAFAGAAAQRATPGWHRRRRDARRVCFAPRVSVFGRRLASYRCGLLRGRCST